jgi:sulfur carrier protein
MKLFVNSEQKDFSGKNICELVNSLNITNIKGLALAVNEKVIPKFEWENFQLKENDKVVIIKATQGG